MAHNEIIDRIIREYAIAGFGALLNDMPLSDLQSLLIEIYNQRAKNISPQELLEQYKKNKFVQPSKVNPKDILAFESLAYQLLPNDFRLLELSPVCPLGTTSVLAPISQKMVLTTIRNTEVCSDATNILALEASLQRKKLFHNGGTKFDCVKFCTSHRLLRTQNFANPLFTQHFQILSVCIAGREEGNFQFEISALNELIPYFYRLLREYIATQTNEKPIIKFKIFIHNKILAEKLTTAIKHLNNSDDVIVTSEMKPDENWNYYRVLRFHIYLHDKITDEDVFIGDGGDTSWTASLLSDKKERFMISGLGSELLIGRLLHAK